MSGSGFDEASLKRVAGLRDLGGWRRDHWCERQSGFWFGKCALQNLAMVLARNCWPIHLWPEVHAKTVPEASEMLWLVLVASRSALQCEVPSCSFAVSCEK